jgi:hypothetical protein
VKTQSCVGYRVCFTTRGIVLCQSRDVKIGWNVGGVYNIGAKEKQGVGGTKEYIHSSSGDNLVQLVRYDNCDSFPAFCWLTNTKQPSLQLIHPLDTS